jgi:tetratricopeptide (TPR) repeat protein
LKHFFTTYYVRSYQPLASLSFAIEYFLFGPNPMVHHVVSGIIHLANVVLVFCFLRELFPSQVKGVLFATGVFALNPIQTEVIAWISARSTLLCSFFYLLSCWSYVRFLRQGKNFYRCSVWFVFALFCKSTAITLPFVLLCIDMKMERKGWSSIFVEKLPLFLLSLIFAVVSLFSRQLALTEPSDFDAYYTLLERVSLAAYSYWFYILKAVFPFQLHNYYEYPLKIVSQYIGFKYDLALLVMILGLGLLVLCRKFLRSFLSRDMVFGLCFFTVSIAPVLSFFSFSPTLLAERYDYLAVVGLAIFAFSIALKVLKPNASEVFFKEGFIGIMVAYAVMSFRQSFLWADDETIWKNTIRYSPSSYAQIHYGNELYKKKDLHGALDHFNEAVRLNPYDPDIYGNRGFVIMELGDDHYAKTDFTRVIEAEKKSASKLASAYFGRAQASARLNESADALSDIDAALKVSPSPEMVGFKEYLVSRQKGASELTAQQSPLSQKTEMLAVVERAKRNILVVARDAFAKKDFQKTILQCQTYLSLDPRSLEARALLTQAQLKIK